MPIRWKSKVILAKIESSYGTDPSPTGGANAMLMTQVTLSPMEGEDVSRDLEFPYLAAQALIPTGLRVRLTGRVELVPSGTAGTAPAWGPLLRACGCGETIVADTSVTYNPITASQESVTMHFWLEGTRHIIKGARGNATFRFTAQGIPYIEFDLLGLYAQPAAQSQASPTLTGFKKPVIVTKTNTPTFSIDSVNFVLRELTMNLGNQVEPRLLVGAESIFITDRAELVRAVVEAVPMATWNPYDEAEDQNSIALSLVHGTTAGYIASLSVPTAQLKRLSGFENAQGIVEWPLELVPLPASGNDQWSLALT